MRVLICLIALLAAGCANRPAETAPPSRTPRAAAALVFAPAVVRAAPPIDLSRAGRDNGAYVGYQQTTVLYAEVYTNDVIYGPTPYGGYRPERRAYYGRSERLIR